jgi:hypothetical protein
MVFEVLEWAAVVHARLLRAAARCRPVATPLHRSSPSALHGSLPKPPSGSLVGLVVGVPPGEVHALGGASPSSRRTSSFTRVTMPASAPSAAKIGDAQATKPPATTPNVRGTVINS